MKIIQWIAMALVISSTWVGVQLKFLLVGGLIVGVYKIFADSMVHGLMAIGVTIGGYWLVRLLLLIPFFIGIGLATRFKTEDTTNVVESEIELEREHIYEYEHEENKEL